MARRFSWFSLILGWLTITTALAEPERILVVDSYHHGYVWSDGIRRALAESFGCSTITGECTSRDGRFVLRVEFLDTKRHPETEWRRTAAARVDSVSGTWQPDLVITCDDNAVQDVVLPYLLGGSTPVVFCGVNYDASTYGLPRDNVTGMIEVDETADLVATLRPHAAGDRIGLLVLDSTSGRRDAAMLGEQFGDALVVRLVADYAGWQDAFVAMQDEVDMLLTKQNITGLAAWNPEQAAAFTLANTRIPTGTTTPGTMPCVLVSFIKNPAEQGRWAARTARRILAGTAPSAIPVAANEESRVVLNMQLAARLGIRFPIELIDRATFLEER